MKKETIRGERQTALRETSRRSPESDETSVHSTGPGATFTRTLSPAEPRLVWIEPVKDETAFLCKQR